MNSAALWHIWWEQAELWRILITIILGAVVGITYFQSLRWSINRLSTSKHRFSMFAAVAFARIALFFGVMILVAHKNMVLLLIYLGAFFITKMLFIGYEKKHLIKEAGKEYDAEN